MINYVHDDLEHRSNDARTARCASNQNRLVVLENDSRGHGTERAFARRNGIGVALHESVIVRRTGFRSEIIHLVVQKKSRGARDYLGAERVVDGVSDRDRITYPFDPPARFGRIWALMSFMWPSESSRSTGFFTNAGSPRKALRSI